jgi:hypothetical protein
MRLKEIKDAAHDYQKNSRWAELHCASRAARIIGIGTKYIRLMTPGRIQKVTPESIRKVW